MQRFPFSVFGGYSTDGACPEQLPVLLPCAFIGACFPSNRPMDKFTAVKVQHKCLGKILPPGADHSLTETKSAVDLHWAMPECTEARGKHPACKCWCLTVCGTRSGTYSWWLLSCSSALGPTPCWPDQRRIGTRWAYEDLDTLSMSAHS